MTSQRDIPQSIRDIAEKIAREFQPEKIILFGSYAWGTPGPDSDVDLFVVKDTDRSTREVARAIDRALWGRHIPLDLIVYTPEGVERRLRAGDFFIRDVVERGVRLYEPTATGA